MIKLQKKRKRRGGCTIFFFFSHTSTFQLLDDPWSQVSSLLPPGSCLQFLSRIRLSNPTARRFFIEFSTGLANSRSRAFRKSICAQEKVPTNLYEYALGGIRTHETDFLFYFSHYFPASGQAVVTGVVPSPPQFLPSIFIAHRVQQSHCSSIFHRVLLTHALALSASQFVRKKSPREYIRACTRGDSNSRN